MSRRIALITVCVIATAAACVWLSIPSPIEGVYAFRSPEVTETLELKSGGAFSQRITMDKEVYEATGHWELKSHALTFRGDFLMRFDGSVGKVRKPPLRLSLCPAYWDPRRSRISFSEDYDSAYFVKRAQ